MDTAVDVADHHFGLAAQIPLEAVTEDADFAADHADRIAQALAVAAWRATSATGELQEADSVTGVLALVRAGIGVALLPGCAATLAWEDLAALPLRQHTPPVDTVVVWRPQDDAPVVRRFLRVALSTPEPDVLGPDHARA